MSVGDFIDDDADVGAAAQRILARGATALGDGEDREDKRENREDREAHEQAEIGEIDDRPEAETKGKQSAEQDADEGEESFLEIPGETEDAEPIRVSTSEAAEAVKQIRQMNGDTAAAVIRAETEAQDKADKFVSGMAKAYEAVETNALTAIQMMDKFFPQMPDRSMLDDRSENYDPQGYYARKAYFDEFKAHRASLVETVKQARQGQSAVMTEAEKADAERENTRLARYIPEWGKEETRTAKKAEIVEALKGKYGITPDDFEGVTSHKAWRMMNDLAKLTTTQAKAPEIKKAIQEKAAKIVNGKMPSRDPGGSGRFVSEGREQLRKSGSVDDAAAFFMRSGLTRGL